MQTMPPLEDGNFERDVADELRINPASSLPTMPSILEGLDLGSDILYESYNFSETSNCWNMVLYCHLVDKRRHPSKQRKHLVRPRNQDVYLVRPRGALICLILEGRAPVYLDWTLASTWKSVWK